jgi:hypothetical protein
VKEQRLVIESNNSHNVHSVKESLNQQRSFSYVTKTSANTVLNALQLLTVKKCTVKIA